MSALFLVAGGLALALAAIGLYGIMAFWVAQRTREIGLRMAIGGGRGTIVSFVLRRGMTPVILGLAFGLLAALPVAWSLREGFSRSRRSTRWSSVGYSASCCARAGSAALGPRFERRESIRRPRSPLSSAGDSRDPRPRRSRPRHYHFSANGRRSTSKLHADRSWCARCHTVSAIASGLAKKSSGAFGIRLRVHGRSITASMIT